MIDSVHNPLHGRFNSMCMNALKQHIDRPGLYQTVGQPIPCMVNTIAMIWPHARIM